MAGEFGIPPIALLKFLIIAVTGLMAADLNVRPVINYPSEFTVEDKATVVFECNGTDTVTWVTPTYSFLNCSNCSSSQNDPNGKLGTRVRVTNREIDGITQSILEITEVTYWAVGLYTCYYPDPDLFETENATAYMFVNESNHLFAKPDLAFGYVMRPLIPFTIPLRATHKDVIIKLKVYGSNIDAPLGSEVEYDHKFGYQFPRGDINLINRPLQGVATYNRIEKRTSIIVLNYDSSVTPDPHIDGGKSRMMEGNVISLMCYCHVPRGNFITMSWKYPNTGDHITVTKTQKQSTVIQGAYADKFFTNLTVSGASPKDSGEYMCEVKSGAKMKTETKEITVYSTSFVNLKPKEQEVTAEKGQTSAKLIVNVDAFPVPLLQWYKGGKMIATPSKKYDSRQRAKKAELKIKFIVKEDDGVYTLKASTRDQNTTVDLKLHVNEPPVLQGADSQIVYESGKFSTLVCRASLGKPNPVYTWHWQSCKEIGCEPREDRWEHAVKGPNGPRVINEATFSKIQFTAYQSGLYRCTAENKLGNDTQVHTVFVTDISKDLNKNRGFAVEGPPMVTEGDDLTLTCRSTKYKYSAPQLYFMKQNDRIKLVNSNTTTLDNNTSEYSLSLSVTLRNNQFENAGEYRCVVTDHKAEESTVHHSVAVRAMVPPSFRKSTDSVKYIAGQQHSIECKAMGLPKPVVYWMKDGADLVISTNQTRLRLLEGNTKLHFNKVETSDAGVYTCTADNRAGKALRNVTVEVDGGGPGPAQRLSKGAIAGIALSLIVPMLVLLLIIFYLRRREQKLKINLDEYLKPLNQYNYNPDIPVDEQTDCLAYDQGWEFPKENLHFGKILGQGAFGKVLMAEAIDIGGRSGSTTVAVKMARDGGDREQVKALLSELKVLIHIGQHLNIVNLLGACTKDINRGGLCVIVEYCAHGSLRSYLLHHRTHFINTMEDLNQPASPQEDRGAAILSISEEKAEYINVFDSEKDQKFIEGDGRPLTTKDLVCYAFQIARGMEYLASRKYVHRDLAARNVLVADDKVVKIADFGLAKDTYKYDFYKKKSSGPVPVKWMALESLTHRMYTSKSDVWSFGVLLWELFSIGGSPYPGMDLDEHFVQKIKSGYRMEQPTFASDEMYEIMTLCWESDPDDRPDFTQLTEKLGDSLHISVKQHYIDLNSDYKQIKKDAHYLNMEGESSSDGGNGYMKMRPSMFLDDDKSEQMKKKSGNYDHLQSVWPKSQASEPTEKTPMLQVTESDDPGTSGKIADSSDREADGYLEPVSFETKPVIHGDARSDTSDERQSSLNDPFLSLGRTSNPVKMRTRQLGQQGNDSVTSDTSSGFHSDYIPEDSGPPEYNAPRSKGESAA